MRAARHGNAEAIMIERRIAVFGLCALVVGVRPTFAADPTHSYQGPELRVLQRLGRAPSASWICG